jgi:capsular polysaccharide biosynthesis protein
MLRLIVLRLLDTYLRHRFLWLLPIAGMIAFAAYNYVSARPSYISLAAVYINKETLLADVASLNQGNFAWVTPAQATTDQVKELFQTDAFIRSVLRLTDRENEITASPGRTGDLIEETRRSIWVNTLGSNTLVIGATSGNASLAQQLAAGAIEVFLQWKINTGHQATTAALAFYKDLVTTYSDEVNAAEDGLKAYLDAHPAPVRGDRPPSEDVEIDRLRGRLAVANERLKKAQDNLESSQLTEKLNESTTRQQYLIVDAPNFPYKSTQSNKSLLTNSIIFVVVGIFLAIGGVVLGALLDQAVRFPEDVTLRLNLPVFAVLPKWKPVKAGRRKPGSKPKQKPGPQPGSDRPSESGTAEA